jgi:hypothetical protein
MNRLSTPFAAMPARAHIDVGTSPAVAERLMSEGLKSLLEIASALPPVRGKRVSTSSVLRWVLRGKQGIRLEAVKLHGSAWWSSMPALARFSAALTAKNVTF